MKREFLLFALLFFGFLTIKAQDKVPVNFCISDEAKSVITAVNNYRSRVGMDALEPSLSLSYVAYMHAKDIKYNLQVTSDCNMHSWSDQGEWKAVCHPSETSRTNSPWDKPKELTSYPVRGYELLFYDNKGATVEGCIETWKSEETISSMLVNTKQWSKFEWNVCGACIFENYVVIWFGAASDPQEPKFCTP